MLTLYYSPGACSLASHIALEETQEPYEAKQTLLSKDEHKTEAYFKINPRGKVPSLSVDGEVITENTAILTYLGKRFPKAKMWPTDPIEEARCVSQMAWFSNTPHIAQRGIITEIEEFLGTKTWMMGDQYTVCDPYALVFYGWGIRAGLPMADLRAFTAFKDRMFQRPAVHRVVEREQTPYLASFL